MSPRTTWQTVYLVVFILVLVFLALLFYESAETMISDRYRVEPRTEPVLPEVLLTVTPALGPVYQSCVHLGRTIRCKTTIFKNVSDPEVTP